MSTASPLRPVRPVHIEYSENARATDRTALLPGRQDHPTSTVTKEQQRFIESMGDYFEAQGYPRISGRLLALLMLNPGPASLDELAETLQVSKGSISSNARMLESIGIAERIRHPGDRRDFYQIAEDAETRMMRFQLERLAELQKRLEQGRAAVPPEQESVLQRFDDSIRRNREMTAMIREKLGSGEA